MMDVSRRFPGVWVCAKILDGIAAGIASGEIEVPQGVVLHLDILRRELPLTALPLGIALRQGILALAAGLLGAAAFWPISLWPLMLVSLSLFLRLLRDQDTQTARNIGLVYGLTFAAGTMHWMFLIFGVLAIPLLAIMAAYFGLLATLSALTRGFNVAARVCLVALFAVAVEWLRGDAWYLRFPWYTPAHALASTPPMVAGARWLGAYGLSFAIWLLAAAGAFRPLAYAGFLLLPACWLLLPADGEPDCRVVLVQSELGSIERVISAMPDEKADLSVLPELAYTCSPQLALSGRNSPAVLARKTRGSVVFGAIEGTYGQMPFSNVAAVIDPDGQLLGTFPKQRPVPLMIDGTPGDRQPVFPVDRGVLGVAICYDFDAPALAASVVHSGATVLVAPTMDAMSWGESTARASRPALSAQGSGERPMAVARQLVGALRSHQPARSTVRRGNRRGQGRTRCTFFRTPRFVDAGLLALFSGPWGRGWYPGISLMARGDSQECSPPQRGSIFTPGPTYCP